MDKRDGEKNVLVFNLGSGTFDVSLLTIDNGVFEVLATNGDTHIGGEHFDQRVMKHFIKQYNTKKGKGLGKDVRAVQKPTIEVEKAKRALSAAHQVRVEVESLMNGEDFSETLKLLENSELQKKEIDDIVLIGVSTKISVYPKKDIDMIINDAKKFADEDSKLKSKVELESFTYR